MRRPCGRGRLPQPAPPGARARDRCSNDANCERDANDAGEANCGNGAKDP